MGVKLPMVMCANNSEKPKQLDSEFPGRLGVLLTPNNWKDPLELPYVLDNGRYSCWSSGKEWNSKAFRDLLEQAKGVGYDPLWVVVPDVVGDGEATLAEWEKWSPRLRKYGWNLALAVQQGITPELVKALKDQPDVIFVGGGNKDDWKWRTAEEWCREFPRVHIGGVGTEKRLWIVQRVGAESSDSNIWWTLGKHLGNLQNYLTQSSEGKRNPTEGIMFGESKKIPKDQPMVKSNVVKHQKITKRFAAYCGDCCEVLPDVPAESVGFSIFSPPFGDLYKYSDDDADMGNSNSPEEFFEHFTFLVEQLRRVMMPGRIVAVHCMDLPTFKSRGQDIGIWDFPGDIIRCFLKFGFIQHTPRITIWKDPLLAATRTKSIQLAHKQIVKDSAMCGTGIPDYIVAFRTPGDNPVPIANPEGLTEYHGKRSIPTKLDESEGFDGDQRKNKRSHWIWQQYASPVWFDIRQTRTLRYREAREGDDEKHICPLQLDTIERCLALWSTKDDVVLTPFMGVGSEVYCAVRNGRRAIGIELKESYYKQALRNLDDLKRKMKASKGFRL